MSFAIAGVLAVSAAAAFYDLRSRRIPNALAAALFIFGLVSNAFAGWHAVLADLIIAGAILIAGTFAFSFKLIGGGDVKLLAAAAGTLGFPAALSFVLYSLLCGGILGVVFAALRGRLAVTFANVAAIAAPLAAGVRPPRPHDGIAMPYAVAIFAGALCLALVNAFAPQLRLLQ